MKVLFRSVALCLACLIATDAFATRRSTMTMKRGRGSFKEESGMENSNVRPMGVSGTSPASSKKWIPVAGIQSMDDLPQEKGKVALIDTMADALMNGATNPTGAVSVVRYGANTYCFSSSCSSCKIPLVKAKVMEANEETSGSPRLVCDFCSATYNLRTGERLRSVGGSGILGGIVKGLFSAKDSAPLPVYELGEQKGKVLINLA